MFTRKTKVHVGGTEIEELLSRGVSAIYPSREFLEQRLKSGERLTVYLGIDPTGPTLHLGHAITILKLAEFQALGHHVILLIGDFTAMIGDPTDKMAVRTSLSRKEVLENAKRYKQQASPLLDFKGVNAAVLKYNSKWLAGMSMADTAKLFSQITYAQTIKRDMFQKRLAEDKDLFLHEFMYPVLQGYDSVAMDVDGEVGGNDQTFNMLVGRDLMKKMKNKEKFVLTSKLLTDSSGKKMGKTEGNMVALDESADQMFGKVMSWDDSLILSGLELCTRVSIDRISELKVKLEQGLNPRDAKLLLAGEIVKLYHGDKKAKAAEQNFLNTFSKKEVPENVEEVSVKKDSLLVDHLVYKVGSKTNFRRLIQSGAVKNAETGEKITDPFYKISADMVIRFGPHSFIKFVVSG